MSNPENPYYSHVEKRPERLSDERMGNLISALHTEKNCITHLVVNPETIHSRSSLYRAVMQAQGEKVGWKMNGSLPFDCCRRSLAPNGLVAREPIDANLNISGYKKTDYGERVGDPLAGLLLDWSRRYPNVSLYRVFGSTSSSSRPVEIESQSETMEYKKRSPIVRLKIFRELAAAELPIRNVDLAERIGEGRKITSVHFNELSRYGIVTYKARDQGQPYSFYRLSADRPDEFPPAFRRLISFTQNVYQVLSSDPEKWWTREEIADQIERLMKEKRKNLIDATSGILSHLQKHGYSEREKFSEETQSVVTLTEDQREPVVDLVNTLNLFQNQEPQILQRGRELAAYFVVHPQEVSQLMFKAKEHSPSANWTPSSETEDCILSIIKDNPDIVSSQIRYILEEKYEKRLTRYRIWELLDHLKNQELILWSKEKGKIKWRINS